MKRDILGLTENDYENVEVNSDRWLDLTDLKNEVWRDIVDFENLYQISNYGRVKRLESIREYIGNNQTGVPFNVSYKISTIILKLKLDRYLRIQLTDKNNSHKYYFSVHRLVAQAFIPNNDNLPEIDHIDRNTYNNKLCNLQWVTCSENSQLAWERGRKRICGKEHHTSKKIGQYDLQGNLIATYYGSGEASRATGISDVVIRTACRGGYGCKTRKGYIWKYI